MFGREPAVILSAVSAALLLAVGFGLEVSTDQQTLIMGAVGAVISLVTGAATRTQVTPV
jgi:hypothetical protein